MTDKYDVIVIGAGHNGLAAAITLADAGQRVLVLERQASAGGALALREFCAGFRAPAYANAFYGLSDAALRALGVSLDWADDDLPTAVLGRDSNIAYTSSAISGVSDEDETAFLDCMDLATALADFVGDTASRPPPRLKPKSLRGKSRLLGLGLRLRRLGRADMREFLRLIGQNMYDELNARFDDPYLKGALGFDATLGTHTGPRSPGNCLYWLNRLSGRSGRIAVPKGGVTALADAMLARAESMGVDVKTNADVEKIVVQNGRVVGAKANGECYSSLRVLSSLGAKTTMLGLVGPTHFETGHLKRVQNVRANGNVARVHLALDGLPDLPASGRARYVSAGTLDDVERSFNPAKYGQMSERFGFECYLPSTVTPALAPEGQHVLCANLQFVPRTLGSGWTGKDHEELFERAVATLAERIPGLRERIIDGEALSPAALESQYGLDGGHWHQAELSLDQYLFVRPFVGAAQYALPLEGLYLCGAGAHPGGNITALPGRLAAEAMLKQGVAR